MNPSERPNLPGPGDQNHQIAALLRTAADGELTPAGEAALAEHLAAHPQEQARIDFERQLRATCGRVMGGVRAPKGLRERVLAAAAESATSEPGVVAILDGSGRRAGNDRAARKGIGMGGKLIGYAAVGALLIGGAFAYRMYHKSQIEAEMLATVGGATSPEQVANFVAEEHRSCWSDEGHRQAKLRVTDPAAVPDACRSWVGRTVVMDDCLASGLEFIGGGECGVPPQGARSAHLLFRTPESQGEPVYVSLFIQVYRPDGTEIPLEDGAVYTLKPERGEVPILAWRKGGLVHYLVSESPEQAGRMREAMKVAEPSRTL